ncbi:hypothetical protein CH379_018035 [Leptospira ellisii]|uniref:DUF6908 domain-containing protein n=1 Tax=Leptospira ellisii TaxID=2023197 RepID=A0A2N0B8D6_9LEPT|nr:hypothetical protein [Leptospira ellisii]MDV6237536.1 hypothetical protein [Leptospira ellisii]PJZ92814.1 hypothetical protein CH379_11190 [Leptospira ellisii]PKA05188.1 hypothetical protein CH375_06560 [Leptospira ellisii]
MKNILKLIDENGGLEKLKNRGLRVKNNGYMDLVIEYIGVGPQNKDAISVLYSYVQNGDLIRDPEVCFELIEEDSLKMDPFLFLQDGFRGRYDEVYPLNEDDSIESVSLELQKDIQSFCIQWDKNLKDQKFFDSNYVRIEEI